MRKIITLLLALVMLFTLAACSEKGAAPTAPEDPEPAPSTGPEKSPQQSEPPAESDPPQDAEPPQDTEPPESAGETERTRVLVVYFSCTSNTKGVAEKIAALTGADIYEIVPAEPYSDADINYHTDCRANREQNDPDARPDISGDVEGWDRYDIVFLGHPIWWGVPPRIISTFVESHDLSGKTIVPFCTSGSSPYNDSGIKNAAGSDTVWMAGKRFAAGASESDISKWIDSLGLELA